MGKIQDYGLIGVLSAVGLGFLIRYYHKPLRTIKFYRHKFLKKDVISDKVIEIELIKKDKSGLNVKTRIEEIKFCLWVTDRYNTKFLDDSFVKRIDEGDLVLDGHGETVSFKIKLPFEFNFKYFDAKELKLTISYREALNQDFIIHDRIIDLFEIPNNFRVLIEKQIELIDYKSSLSTEEGLKIFNQELPIRDVDEEYELNEDQFTLDDNGNWINSKGETMEEYDKRKADEK